MALPYDPPRQQCISHPSTPVRRRAYLCWVTRLEGLRMTSFSSKSWCANSSRAMSIGSLRWWSMQLEMASLRGDRLLLPLWTLLSWDGGAVWTVANWAVQSGEVGSVL